MTAITQRELMEKLHEVNPYDHFDSTNLESDLQGFGYEPTVFEPLLDQIKPSLLIEVGTWKGASAIAMALYARQKGYDTAILCVDTWLGGLEHLVKKEHPDPAKRAHFDSLRIKNGYPQIYAQFLFNVIHNGVQGMIIPFPNTSTIAAHWLERQEIRADFVYIDGSHLEEDVFHDVSNYFRLVREGGILVADDYTHPNHTGPHKAVDRFVASNKDALKFTQYGKNGRYACLTKQH